MQLAAVAAAQNRQALRAQSIVCAAEVQPRVHTEFAQMPPRRGTGDNDLEEGRGEWVEVPEIVRLTFKALHDVVKAQGEAIKNLERGLAQKVGKSEQASALAEKVNLSEIGQTFDELSRVIDAKADGPVVIVGSSLGGWLMLLTALALVQRDGPGRVAGLVGIAAAPDFTDWGFSEAEKAIILAEGELREETPYSDQPYVTTRRFFQSGAANHLLGGPIPLACPVRLLHGEADGDVPPEISLRLSAALVSEDVKVTLVKGGDHRLSRDTDIALLIDTVARLATAN